MNDILIKITYFLKLHYIKDGHQYGRGPGQNTNHTSGSGLQATI
jgi:hypothetical protein